MANDNAAKLYKILDMLEKAGLGIAMGNAKEEIQKAADYITASNEENGVALALEKFFLTK